MVSLFVGGDDVDLGWEIGGSGFCGRAGFNGDTFTTLDCVHGWLVRRAAAQHAETTGHPKYKP